MNADPLALPPELQPSAADLQPASPPQGSILDDLRAVRTRKADATPPTLTLAIAGYGEPSRLGVVYRYPTAGYEVVIEATDLERLGTEKDAQLHGNADLLSACCASLVGRRPNEDGKTFTLLNLDTDEPVTEAQVIDQGFPAVRFNRALADKLGILCGPDVEKVARFVCREVFSPGGQATGRYEGDIALIAHGNVIFQWLQGVERDRETEQAGE